MSSLNLDMNLYDQRSSFFEKYRPIPESVFVVKNSIYSKDAKSNRLQVSWKNLSYSVPKESSLLRKPSCFSKTLDDPPSDPKAILNNLSGHFKSGELTAIMGPSGCGKTTLLECLAGKRQSGVTGDITFSGSKDVKLSFISQNDQLLAHLTVRESLIFASKLKNYHRKAQVKNQNALFSLDVIPSQKVAPGTHFKIQKEKSKFDHESVVQKLLDQFGLNICAEVPVSNCSGGQLKRLSIAQELVSQPNLLILDEPTSGLDSASCFQCIELLQQLTQHNNEQPLAVVATIHQPSARVFNMFHKVIFLSTTGRCVYEGLPSDLVSHLSSVGLQCPPFNNPADYMTEIASGDYGVECIHTLADASIKEKEILAIENSQSISQINKKLNNRKHLPFIEHISLLFKRTSLSIIRDPMLTTIRFLSHIIVAIFIGLLYGSKIGKASGCPPAYDMDNMGSVQKHLYEDIIATGENVANLFFASMFVMYGAMLPTVLTFPLELNVFLKEKRNGWYTSRTYYLAKTLADVPMQIVFPVLYGAIIFLMNGQVFSYWRFSMFLLILILCGLVAQSQGLVVSALFMHDPNGAVFVGPMTSIPFLLFAGFFVRVKTMPSYLVPFSYMSYVRYAFEALVANIYGFNRCLTNPMEIPVDPQGVAGSALFKFLSIFLSNDYYGEDGEEGGMGGLNATEVVSSNIPNKGLIESIVKDFQSNNPFMSEMFADRNSTESYVLKQFDLSDASMYVNITRLLICFLVFRIAAYLILLWKTDRKR